MKIKLLFILLMPGSFARAQTAHFQLIDSIYLNWVNNYHDEKLNCDTFYYAETFDDYTIEIVRSQFEESAVFYTSQDSATAGKIIFTPAERKYIDGQLVNLNQQQWPDKLFPRSKVIKFEQIDLIQNSINSQKLDPLLRLCYQVYVFSHPIFLRNDSICLFYFGNTDFAVKDGEFWIYERKDSTWNKLAPVYRWIK